MQRVLAGFIGKESNPLSIGGPSGIAVCDAWGISEVADVAVLDGNGENFAMRFKDGARAGGRDVSGLDVLGGLDEMTADRREVPGHLNFHGVLFAAGGIEKMERAELFVNDGVRAGRGGFDVHAVAGNGFADLLGRGVVNVEIHGAVAVRE